jgi:hypothetical protein
MYSEDPDAQVQSQIELTKKQPVKESVNYSALETLDNSSNFLHVELMQKIGKVYNQAKTSLPRNTTIDEYIPSMLILGVGLGYHLERLNYETKACYISIFEPNEDYFFASLFCFDWASYLAKLDEQGAYLYLGIGDSEEEIVDILLERAKEVGIFSLTNCLIYQHYPSKNMADLIARLRDRIKDAYMGWGFFDDALMSIAHSIGTIKKQPHFFDQNAKLSKQFEQYPVFIIANGPSLDNDIEIIKQLKSQVIIVSCNSATTTLLKNGITPHFHVAVERTKATYDFIAQVIGKEACEQMNFLTLNVMYPDTLDLFKWSGIALKGSEAGTILFQLMLYLETQRYHNIIGYSNPLVGNTALSFIAHMGFKNIYLFGMDCGYVDPQYHHSKDSFYFDDKGNEKFKPIKLGEEFAVEGNFAPQVITEPLLYTSKQQFERLLTRQFKEASINCFNCSNGVKIKGTIPLRSEDIILNSSVAIPPEKVVEWSKQNLFKDLPDFSAFANLLAFDEFQQICQTMIEFLEKPIHNRADAFNAILTQLRYLASFKGESKLSHLYLLLEGEVLYTNSVLISLLYQFGDDESIIPYFKEALGVWIQFLKDAPEHYRERWNKESVQTIQL